MGNPKNKAFFFRDLQATKLAIEYLQKTGWLTSETQEQIIKIYRQQLYMPTRADDYDRFVSMVDFAIGYRVHGVLPALANGTPGALVKYDVRGEELARTHKIPLISEEDIGKKSWRELYERLDFDTFQREYVKGHDQLSSFLSRNGIPHLL